MVPTMRSSVELTHHSVIKIVTDPAAYIRQVLDKNLLQTSDHVAAGRVEKKVRAREFTTLLNSDGIVLRTANTNTPQQNGSTSAENVLKKMVSGS